MPVVGLCPLCSVDLQPLPSGQFPRTTGRPKWVCELRASMPPPPPLPFTPRYRPSSCLHCELTIDSTQVALKDWNHAELLGVGYRWEGKYYFPSNTGNSYFGETAVTRAAALETDSYFMVVHEACWRVLLTCFPGRHEPDFPEVLALYLTLFEFFSPQDYVGNTVTRNDYGGVGPWHRLRRVHPQLRIESYMWPSLSWILKDPFELDPNAMLSQQAKSRDDLASSVPATLSSQPRQNTTSDTFHGLPCEILHVILTFLPLKDVCSFRVASRSVAALCHPSALPQSFWESRFNPNLEMGFFFAGQTSSFTSRTDWRTLYSDLRDRLSGKDNRGLRNRRRIWLCAQAVKANLLLKVRGHYSSPLDQPRTRPGDIRARPGAHVYAQTLLYREDTAPFVEGRPVQSARTWAREDGLQYSWGPEAVRVLAAWDILFPSPTGVKINASFVTFNRVRYLSGMTAKESRREEDDPYDAVHLGITETGDEECLQLFENEAVTCVRVYCRSDGVAGLSMSVRNLRTSERDLRVVGDVDISTGEIGVAYLYPADQDSKISGLTLGFDVRLPPTPMHLVFDSISPNAHVFLTNVRRFLNASSSRLWTRC